MALWLVYKDYVSNFHELLEKDISVTIHNLNLHYKISPRFIRELVMEEDPADNNTIIDPQQMLF